MFGFGKSHFRSPRKRLAQWSPEGKSHKDNTRVRVYVRARPLYDDDDDLSLREPLEFPTKKEVKLVEQKQETTYKFDRVFSPEASNAEVCKAVSEPLINTVIDGYNGSFMVYGQTGTGKTYTVLSDDGLIPQTILQLFQRTQGDKEYSYRVYLSYLQIYKDKIYDLLDPTKDLELHLREHPQEGVIVDGLKEFEIPDPTEAEKLLEYGRKNLIMAETKMVRLSSRSHSLCVIRVEKFKSNVLVTNNSESNHGDPLDIARNALERDEKLWKGKLYLCDLAGSERLKKTGAAGNRFQEARYINSSLLELGNVIHALADSRHAHVPFRNSTLTRLLKESLGGNSKASLMICISSSIRDINETKCSLNFGQRAMRVTKFSTPNVELQSTDGSVCDSTEFATIDYKALAEYLTKKLKELESAYHVEKENYKQLKKELSSSKRHRSRIPVLRNRLPPPDTSPQADLKPLIQLAKSQLELVQEEEKAYLSHLRLIEQSTTTDDFPCCKTAEASTETTHTSFGVSSEAVQVSSTDLSFLSRENHVPEGSGDCLSYNEDLSYTNNQILDVSRNLDVSADQIPASYWNSSISYQDDLKGNQVTLLRSSCTVKASDKIDFGFKGDSVDRPIETSERIDVCPPYLKTTMGNASGKDEPGGEVQSNDVTDVVQLRRKSEELTDVTSKRKSANRLSAFLEIVKLRDGGEGAKFREVDLRWHSEADSGSLSSAVSTPRNSQLYRNSYYEIQSRDGSLRNLNNVEEEENNRTPTVAKEESPKVVMRAKKGKGLSRLFRRHSLDESRLRMKKKEKRLSATLDENVQEINGNLHDLPKKTKSVMFDDHAKNKEIVLAALKNLEGEDLTDFNKSSSGKRVNQSAPTNGQLSKLDSVEKPVENVNTLNKKDVMKLSSEPISNATNNLVLRSESPNTISTCQTEQFNNKSLSSTTEQDTSTRTLTDTHSIVQTNNSRLTTQSGMDVDPKLSTSVVTKALSSIVMDSEVGTMEVVVDKTNSTQGNRLYVRNRGRESFVFETDMAVMDFSSAFEPSVTEPVACTPEILQEKLSIRSASRDENSVMTSDVKHMADEDHVKPVEGFVQQTESMQVIEDPSSGNFASETRDPFDVLNSSLELIEPPGLSAYDTTDRLFSGSHRSPIETSNEQSVGQRQADSTSSERFHETECFVGSSTTVESSLLCQDIIEHFPSKEDQSKVISFHDRETLNKIEEACAEYPTLAESTSKEIVNKDTSKQIEASLVMDAIRKDPDLGNEIVSSTKNQVSSQDPSSTKQSKVRGLLSNLTDAGARETYDVMSDAPNDSIVTRPTKEADARHDSGVAQVPHRKKTDKTRGSKESHDGQNGIWDSFDMEMDKVDKVNVRDSMVLPDDENKELMTTKPTESHPPVQDFMRKHAAGSNKAEIDSKDAKRRSLVMKAILIEEVMENANTYDANDLEAITRQISLIGDETTDESGQEQFIVGDQSMTTASGLPVFKDTVAQIPERTGLPEFNPVLNGHSLSEIEDFCDELGDSYRDTDSPFDFSEVSDENRNYIHRPGSVHSSLSTDTELELVHAMEESDKLRASLSNVKRQYDDILTQFDSLLGSKSTTERELENTREYLAETMKCKIELEEELEKAREQLALVSAAHKEDSGMESPKSQESDEFSLSPIKPGSEDEEETFSASDDSDDDVFVSQTTLTNVTPIDATSPTDYTCLSPDAGIGNGAISNEMLTFCNDYAEGQHISSETIQSTEQQEKELNIVENGNFATEKLPDTRQDTQEGTKTRENSVQRTVCDDYMLASIEQPSVANGVVISEIISDTTNDLPRTTPSTVASVDEVDKKIASYYNLGTVSMDDDFCREDVEESTTVSKDKSIPQLAKSPSLSSLKKADKQVRNVSAGTQDNLDMNMSSKTLDQKDSESDKKDGAPATRKKSVRRSRPASKIIEEADPKEFRWISKKGLVSSEEKIKRNEQLTLAAIQNAELKKELLLTKLEKIRLEAVLSCVMMRTPTSDVSREYQKLSINSITSSKSTLRSSTSATDLTFSGGSEKTSPFHVSSRRLSSTHWPKTRVTSESSAASPSLSSYDPGLRLSQRESDVISPTSSLFEHSSLLTDSSFSPITAGESSPSASSVVATSMPLSERTAPCGQDRDDQSISKVKKSSSKDHHGSKSVLSSDTTDITSGESRQDLDEDTKKEKSVVGCLPFLKRRSTKKKSKKSKIEKSPAHSDDSYHL